MSRSDDEKLHASVLVAPAKERRRYREQRRRAANQLHREQRQQRMRVPGCGRGEPPLPRVGPER